jgi:hypothetical protein
LRFLANELINLRTDFLEQVVFLLQAHAVKKKLKTGWQQTKAFFAHEISLLVRKHFVTNCSLCLMLHDAHCTIAKHCHPDQALLQKLSINHISNSN